MVSRVSLHFAQDVGAHLRQSLAAAALGEEIRGTPQLIRRVITLELNDAVLHFAVVEHQDHQRTIVGEPDELDLRDGRLLRARKGHDTGEARHVRQQLRRRRDQCLGVVTRGVELAPQFGKGRIVFDRRARLEQRIDEESIALVGGHAPRGGVRRADKAELLEVGNDVADGGRGQREPGFAGQGAGADRLTVTNVTADQHLQQQLFAL